MIIWSVCLFVSRENEWERKGFGEEVEGGTIYKYQSSNREIYLWKSWGLQKGKGSNPRIVFPFVALIITILLFIASWKKWQKILVVGMERLSSG